MTPVMLLMIVTALAVVGGALFATRRKPRTDRASVDAALSRAATLAASGRHRNAGRRYGRIAGQLAMAPPAQRPQRGLALVGQAGSTAALGDAETAYALCCEAFPLLAEPARQMPRWSLARLAGELMADPDPDLAPLFVLLHAVGQGTGPDPVADAAAARVLVWLQHRCREAPTAVRDTTTAAALAALPGADWPVLARAALLRDTGRTAEAEAVLTAAAPRGGGEIWFRRAAMLAARECHAEAVEAYDEALRRDAGDHSPWARGPELRVDALLFRGLARQRLSDHAGAAADLHAAAAEAPADPRPHDALGRLALLNDADDEARGHFTAALAVRPSHTPARLGLALLHERAGRPADAVTDYRTALAADPGWRPARVRLGAALLAAGHGDEAEPLLRAEADADTPWRHTAAFHHGLALARAGDPAGALARWQPLRDDDLLDRLAPQHDRLARRLLATDPAAARAHWQHAAADAPDEPAHPSALREAALREAALLLLTGRDRPEARAGAATALALADSLPPAHTGPGTGPGTARRARLTAALTLAGGSADGLDPLIDPSGGRHDRYHAAAVALLTGRPVKAVARMAAAEPEPDGDPGPARIRALLAERAGNWPAALEWYGRFLANTPAAAGNTLAAAVDAPACGAAHPGACGAAAVDACGGCGREGCATHLYRPEGARSPRCDHCAEPTLAAVLDCARRAGRQQEAERLLTSWAAVLGDGPAGIAVRRDLALLRAEAGDLDAALAGLPAEATGARTAVLVRRAAAALGEDRPGDAAVDLREAVRLTPDHAPAATALGTLAEHEALRHAADGRHQEAWDGFRTLLLADPAHPRLLHSLGLVSYRLATAVPAQAGPADEAASASRERLWRWALACLVPSLHLPEVWAAHAGLTGRDVEEARQAAARAALTDRLRSDLRALDQSLGRTGDDTDALTLRLGMELRCAEAFAREELRVGGPGGASRRLVIGPALDTLLREELQAAELAAWQSAFEYAVLPWRRPGPFGVHPLTQALNLFDDLGPLRHLLAQGRPAAAVAALDATAGDADGDADEARQQLLREALTSQGAAHHRQLEWREALACLARAAALPGPPLGADLVRIAADAGLRAARALLKESDDDQAGAVEILEQARTLAPDDPEVRSNLGAAYAQLARKVNNEAEDFAQALVLLRKALAQAPDDPTARHFLEAALRNRAGELTGPDADGDGLAEAESLWRELVGLGDDPEHVSGLVFVLQRQALIAAKGDRRAVALDRMAQAVRLDPDFDGNADREAARRMAVMLANHTMEALQDLPFDRRAGMLRLAQTYDDSPDLRAVMVNVWRAEAGEDFGADRFENAASLLEQALQMGGTADAMAMVRKELGIVYSAHAVRRANARQLRQARSLVAKAVEYSPGDQDLRLLQRRINNLS